MTAWQTAGASAFLKLINGFDGAEDHIRHVSAEGLRKIAQSGRALAAMADDEAARRGRYERDDIPKMVWVEGPPRRATPEPYGGYEPPYGGGARIRS